MTSPQGGAAVPWPKPLPKWFWAWARWALGEGEYKQHGPRKGPRPKTAPERIPEWAWKRLEALVAQRNGEQLEPEPADRPKPTPPKPPATPHQKLMAARRRLAQIAIEIAERTAQGHYSQARPAQHTRDHVTLADVRAGRHWTGDCSSTVGDWLPRLAGLDPGPDGSAVNTWNMTAHWPRVHTPALGDAVMYHGHVGMIEMFRHGKPTRDLDDIFIWSHGSEAGPYGNPPDELAASYRYDDWSGFYRHPSLVSGDDL